MNKKAVTHVAAFQLSGGVFKTENNVIDVSRADNYLPGEMKASDTISCLYGLGTGYWVDRPSNRYQSEADTAEGKYSGSSVIIWISHQSLLFRKKRRYISSLTERILPTISAWLYTGTMM